MDVLLENIPQPLVTQHASRVPWLNTKSDPTNRTAMHAMVMNMQKTV
jgi:hypothetical protein